MQRTCALVVVAFLLGGVAIAVGQGAPPGRIYGAGVWSCGQWSAVQKPETQFQQVEQLAMTSWVQGFVTAASLYPSNPPRNTDGAAITAWLDNYCSAHPLEPLYKASIALVYELTPGQQ